MQDTKNNATTFTIHEIVQPYRGDRSISYFSFVQSFNASIHYIHHFADRITKMLNARVDFKRLINEIRKNEQLTQQAKSGYVVTKNVGKKCV